LVHEKQAAPAKNWENLLWQGKLVDISCEIRCLVEWTKKYKQTLN